MIVECPAESGGIHTQIILNTNPNEGRPLLAYATKGGLPNPLMFGYIEFEAKTPQRGTLRLHYL